MSRIALLAGASLLALSSAAFAQTQLSPVVVTAPLQQSQDEMAEATTVVDLMQDGNVLVPAGSVLRGHVASVSPAGKIDRSGSLTLTFDQLSVRGRTYTIKGMAAQVFESGGIKEEATTVGAAGAVGAIVGGIIGGLKGALIGAAVGAGGVIAATEGKDVVLPGGTLVRVRLDTPVRIR